MTRKHLSRRRIRLAAVLVSAGALAVTTGCGGGGTSGSVTPADLVVSTPPAAGEIDKVSWALPMGEPATVDPVKAGDYSPNTVVSNLCEPLMRLTPDFSVEPGLAESVTRPDPTTLVFTIRPGVKFWNGNPLTAADVVHSLRRNLDPGNRPAHADVFKHVADIVQSGPMQVTVTFTRPDEQFLDSMAGSVSAVSEKSFVERAGDGYGTPSVGVMCTGPFRFGRWVPGERIVVTRNDEYWGTKAKAKEFDFVFFTDDSTLTTALVAGQIDGTYEAPIGSLDTLRGSPGGKLYFGPSTQSLSIGPATTTGPAADPRVREALDLAIDKTSLIGNVLHGAGAPLKTFTPPLSWAGDPAKPVFDAGYAALPDTSKPDLARAQALIREAAPAAEPLTLAIPSGDQTGLQTATIVQAAAKQIGLTLDIRQMQPTEFSELFYDPAKRQTVDLVIAQGYIEVPGVYYYSPGFVLPGGVFNWTGWRDAEVERLMTEGQQAADPQVAAEKFVAAQKVFAPARLQISLAQLHERLYMSNTITGAPASFAYIGSAWAAAVGKA
ncbi:MULTISPECIES: ABC transporter substrate-binding protein [Amycolatopsis]|uniref:ABC transporter substrate-binding protein n=1 Tax=Amycolatopsis TaxID=1813 RepID=UPI001178BD7B|nr:MULTISPECIES: ABC transporter substrate-binding protein [Amycolatopsis]